MVSPHLNAAYRFAHWLSRFPHDADDIVQEAILRALRGFDALRGSDVKAWLWTIVRNCHFTALRQQQRRAFMPLPEEHDADDGHAMVAMTPDPESTAMRGDEARTLARSVGVREAQFGSAKATMLLPEGAPFFPPPHTITMYSRPFSW